MTRSPEELRRLDAAVAEAMGWKGICELHGELTGRMLQSRYPNRIPHYTTDNAVAMAALLEFCQAREYYYNLSNDARGHSVELIPIQVQDEPKYVFGYDKPTPAAAICDAILKAMGVEVPSE